MSLDDYLADTADAFVEMLGGETITILPPGEGAVAREVRAIVDHHSTTFKTIEVQNNSLAGISADEVERYGQFVVTVKKNPAGAETVTLPVFVPTPDQLGRPWADAGMVTLFLGDPRKEMR